ncbi:hypothetical protein IMSAGC002_01591 [Lachnospiraceae bacterium]|uniref:Uncharacterized protein n=1 Tax=Parablautia intestinalis TaxID=2320100 RepID=A0A3A9AWW7_9FIRM|nr:hypothetical protein [Parablautia intestinalis]RKI92061.1 hypothetical protein D7V94_08310 [Parablautia intestinalis]GFH90346.1 hypothetical protein IMSAGC002_01591 [Lachnospiraceae bacterium]
MGKYKNPVPVVLDDYVSKTVRIEFSFEQYVTKGEAAQGINDLLRETNGKIPMEWIKLVNPTLTVDKKEID